MLIAVTPELLRLELSDVDAFAAALGVTLAPDWPPGEYDADAVRFFLEQLTTLGERIAGWQSYYVVTRNSKSMPRDLIAAAGFFGPPDEGGTVEIGFSVVEAWRHRGIATEIVGGLLEHAAAQPGVLRVIARSRGDNRPSHGVLLRNGFREVETGDPELRRFEREVGAH